MKTAYCTYCSKQKSDEEGNLPAIQRYISQRIAQVNLMAMMDGVPFFILSGQYGFIPSDYPLPYYDHLLQPEEVNQMSARAAQQIKEAGLETLNYLSNNPAGDESLLPYQALIEKTCQLTGVKLNIQYFTDKIDD
jgi:hypothetical protein